MSRIGKKPVQIPAGLKVEQQGQMVKLSSNSGSLTLDVHPRIKVTHDSATSEILVTRSTDQRQDRALHGTMRALIANMVEGLTKGFAKKLEIYGTGYGVKEQGKALVINVGFAAPVTVAIPEGVKVDISAPNARGNDVPAVFTVSGADKAVVGQFASEIRRSRPPEPYLGKGIRYADEVIKRKVGKAFGSGA